MLGMRTSYILTHPHELIAGYLSEIKWAWQRVFRGWDDRVIWSIDCWLAEKMPVWIEALKQKKAGIPSDCLPKGCHFNPTDDDMIIAIDKWEGILDTISDGFKAAYEISEMSWTVSYEDSYERYLKGMELFVKHFFDLWD